MSERPEFNPEEQAAADFRFPEEAELGQPEIPAGQNADAAEQSAEESKPVKENDDKLNLGGMEDEPLGDRPNLFGGESVAPTDVPDGRRSEAGFIGVIEGAEAKRLASRLSEQGKKIAKKIYESISTGRLGYLADRLSLTGSEWQRGFQQGRIDQAKDRTVESTKAKAELEERLSDLDQQLANPAVQTTLTQNQRDRIASERRQLTKKIVQSEQKVQAHTKEVDDLTKGLHEYETTIGEITASIESYYAGKLKSPREKVATLRGKLAELDEQIVQFEQQAKEWGTEFITAASEATPDVNQVNTRRQQLQEVDTALAWAKSARENVVKKLNAAETTLTSWEKVQEAYRQPKERTVFRVRDYIEELNRKFGGVFAIELPAVLSRLGVTDSKQSLPITTLEEVVRGYYKDQKDSRGAAERAGQLAGNKNVGLKLIDLNAAIESLRVAAPIPKRTAPEVPLPPESSEQESAEDAIQLNGPVPVLTELPDEFWDPKGDSELDVQPAESAPSTTEAVPPPSEALPKKTEVEDIYGVAGLKKAMDTFIAPAVESVPTSEKTEDIYGVAGLKKVMEELVPPAATPVETPPAIAPQATAEKPSFDQYGDHVWEVPVEHEAPLKAETAAPAKAPSPEKTIKPEVDEEVQTVEAVPVFDDEEDTAEQTTPKTPVSETPPRGEPQPEIKKSDDAQEVRIIDFVEQWNKKFGKKLRINQAELQQALTRDGRTPQTASRTSLERELIRFRDAKFRHANQVVTDTPAFFEAIEKTIAGLETGPTATTNEAAGQAEASSPPPSIEVYLATWNGQDNQPLQIDHNTFINLAFDGKLPATSLTFRQLELAMMRFYEYNQAQSRRPAISSVKFHQRVEALNKELAA